MKIGILNLMKADLIVRNANIVLPETGTVAADLVINEGRVAAIGDLAGEIEASDTLDAPGRIVLPGVIDPHVHYGWMPPIEKRIPAESAFGVSGGVTTMIRYIRRPESYLESLDGQIELGNRLHYQDYAVHLTLFSPAQVAEIPQCVERFGVTSFKVYMNMKGRLGRGVFMDLLPGSSDAEPRDVDYNAAHLHDVFSKMAQIPAPLRLNVHCEDGEMLEKGIERMRQKGSSGLNAWHQACSDLSEALAINQAALFSRETGVPVYFPHIGSCAAVAALKAARSQGTDFVAETCPHYLTQTTESAAGVKAKIMPPIRTMKHQKTVWQALGEGLIETIGSDHVAYTLDEKNPIDIWTARPAFAGTGLILPLLLSEGVARNRLSLRQLVQITSYNTARTFGLYPRKGTLLPGADADFVVVDPGREWRVDGGNLLTHSDFCIYEGMALKGTIDSVFVRGVKMFENGKLLGPKGHGRYLRRD